MSPSTTLEARENPSITFRLRRYWDTPFFVELLLLAMAAPVLYFPDRFGVGVIAFAIGLLALGWVWRQLKVAVWYRTPVDWPIFFLFLVMLPMSVWVAPSPLREEYSIPRALILIWNFSLFWVIVSHASRSRELRYVCALGFLCIGGLIASVSLFGTRWPNKLPGLDALLNQLPQIFGGAEMGFHLNQLDGTLFFRVLTEISDSNTNILGGTLLYVLPFLTALVVHALYRRDWKICLPGGMLLGLVGLVFVAAQSRAALLSFAICLPVMALLNLRWGRWILGGGMVMTGTMNVFVSPVVLLQRLDQSKLLESVVGNISLAGRIEIWQRALYGIADFPFTGMGLDTFREIMPTRYPLITPSTRYIDHAHNFFLQMALDFGIPGLLCLLAIFIIAGVMLVDWTVRTEGINELRIWATGLLGSLLASSIYGLVDAVAMGSNPNFVFWILLALIFSLSSSHTS